MKISFIGFGKIAKMMAAGLKSSAYQLYAAAPSLEAGQCIDGIYIESENRRVLQDADYVILAVKPIQASAVLDEISPHLSPHCVLISIMAGVSMTTLSSKLPAQQPIVRAMPNLPMAVQKGATALYKNEWVTEKQGADVASLFNALGLYAWVSIEQDIDKLTALSGSGPAYVFLFLEGLIEGARALGLSQPLSEAFAMQTVKGAVELAQESEMSLSSLRESVISPGGTTEAALQILDKGEFKQLIKDAMQGAYHRALALAKLS